jgi:hypothetical protein
MNRIGAVFQPELIELMKAVLGSEILAHDPAKCLLTIF